MGNVSLTATCKGEDFLKNLRMDSFEDYGVFGLGGGESGSTDSKEPATVPCIVLGPGLLPSSTIAKYWESVALTDDEDRATRALSIAIGENVECLALVHERDNFGSPGSLLIARLNQFNTRVPLKSFGNDAMRLFSVALALSRSKNGLVVIDEVENGIHHTAYDNLWKMVLNAAGESNVQVIATTYGLDCIRAFARAEMGMRMSAECWYESSKIKIRRKLFHSTKMASSRLRSWDLKCDSRANVGTRTIGSRNRSLREADGQDSDRNIVEKLDIKRTKLIGCGGRGEAARHFEKPLGR